MRKINLFPFGPTIFSSRQECVTCGIDMGHFVDDVNDDMVFCNEHATDYVAEKEGWSEYRNKYKSVQEKYKQLNKK